MGAQRALRFLALALCIAHAASLSANNAKLPPALRPGAQRPNPFQTPRERHRKAQSGRGAERHAHDMPMICP